MDPHETTVGEIRRFIKEHLDKTNNRYKIQKQITDEDIDRYISGNPYLHAEIAEALLSPFWEKGFCEECVEEVYHNVLVWVNPD